MVNFSSLVSNDLYLAGIFNWTGFATGAPSIPLGGGDGGSLIHTWYSPTVIGEGNAYLPSSLIVLLEVESNSLLKKRTVPSVSGFPLKVTVPETVDRTGSFLHPGTKANRQQKKQDHKKAFFMEIYQVGSGKWKVKSEE